MSTASINNGQFFFSIDTPSYMVFGLSAGVQNANFNWRPPAQRLGQVTKKFNFFYSSFSLQDRRGGGSRRLQSLS
jgi:hypothetical protein